MQIDGFDWDGANLAKCQKHGVGLAEIETLLLGTVDFSPDVQHSIVEQRMVAVGRNAGGRPIFVGFTVREKDGRMLLRPITARYMHAKEAKRYGTGKAQTGPLHDH